MKITINNKKIEIKKPATLLDIAGQNDIHIPSLCDHPELTPHGGCRLCMVEIEGRNGYPTACTTIVEDGMVVRTDTHILQKMRKDLVQLILSEHPAGCLLCEDVESCSNFQGTIRKVGVTTGCRWCPKDKDCEFQKIVEEFEINELELPGLYRNTEVEKYDPFFDRDYNLCIYCDRCVRICNEYRNSSVLSLKQRGNQTTIGPAFESTHIDALCEFCGACVSVCPTGAMSEKSRKWWGLPEKYEPSVCPICSLNCEIQVLSLKNKIVGTLPPGKPHEAGGELCVKGRFCLSELLNRTERILEPEYKYKEGYGIVSWGFAIDKTTEILHEVKPKRSALFLSPSLSLEEISAAKHLAENVLETEDITSSLVDENLLTYMQLASHSVTKKELDKASAYISVFLNGNYNVAPLTMMIKKAATNGTPYFQIGWVKDTTSRFAQQHLIPTPCEEHKYLDQIISIIKNGKKGPDELCELVDVLKNSKPAIIVGPEIISLSNCIPLLDKIGQIAKLTKAKLYMPNQYGNLNGLMSLVGLKPFNEVDKKIKEGKYDLLYLIGDNPFHERPNVKHIIFQNAFPATPQSAPDVILPTAIWGESGGSYLNTDGKVQKTKSVAEPHGYSLTHQEVFSRIAKKIKIKIPGFKTKELEIEKKANNDITKPVNKHQNITAPGKKYPYVLIQERSQHNYSNLNLSNGVEGFGELVKCGHIILHPKDAKKLKLNNNDNVQLVSSQTQESYPVVIRKQITPGYFYLVSSNGKTDFESNPCPVNVRREHV
ncbi:MAG: molybdopterin-dependent oxidoreductase [Bacteroidota bacterium]